MGKQFLMPPRIFYGEKSLNDAAESVASLGKKALIVTDKMMIELGNVRKVTDMLDKFNVLYEIFDGISGEPTDKMVAEGFDIWCNSNCDFLIAVGGGSPIDAMKAVGVVATSGGCINDYLGKVITVPTPPMVAIPTTSGTGSEATQFTIITNTEKDIKMLLKGPVLMPDIAIDDPEFTFSAPMSVTAATGLDALCHAAEAYTSKKAQPMTDGYALSAVKRIFEYLPVAFKDGSNRKAREEMSIAAFEAGIAFNNSSVTIIHGMSRPIGALFHVPHGISNAMLMTECFSFVRDGAEKRFADLARATGKADLSDSDTEASLKFIDACNEICKICNIPTLSEYGIDIDKFRGCIPKMSADAFASGSPSNTVKEITVDDIVTVYNKLCK